MADHDHASSKLTRNQSLVLNALNFSHTPLSAYSILDQVRRDGMRAPLQVYRALEKLVELGMVHKLESLNAFVACSHPKCASHVVAAFEICDGCENVLEIADDKLNSILQDLAGQHAFRSRKTVVEMRGICDECNRASKTNIAN